LRNWAPLPISASSLNAIVLTHAHLDHSGYPSLLVKQGYRGPVFCAEATFELCRKQWVAQVASGANAPHVVLRKTRRGDHDVEVSLPDMSDHRDRAPVLIDDIVSTARMMIAAVSRMRDAGLPPHRREPCGSAAGAQASLALDYLTGTKGAACPAAIRPTVARRVDLASGTSEREAAVIDVRRDPYRKVMQPPA
jgi:hypothetical protein